MAGERRLGKGQPWTPAETLGRRNRFAEVIKQVQAIYPQTDAKKMRDAFSWYEDHFAKCVATKKSYPFPDPLCVAEYMATRNTKGEAPMPSLGDAITAALLVPSVARTEDQGYNPDRVLQIGKTFSKKVAQYVKWSVQLGAVQLLPIAETAKQTRVEQLAEYRLACLEIAHVPAVVLIDDAYRLKNLQAIMRAAQHEVAGTRQKVDTELKAIYDILGPVAYRAGLAGVRYDLLDHRFRQQNPERYERVAKRINETVAEEDLSIAMEIIKNYICDQRRIPADMVMADWRVKTPNSVDEKTNLKSKKYEELRDVAAGRFVFSERLFDPAISDKVPGQYKLEDFARLPSKAQKDYLIKSGKQLLEIHNLVNRAFGQDSSDPRIEEHFRGIAALDPHPSIPGKANTFDNYIDNPKQVPKVKGAKLDLGYSGVQNSFVVFLPNGRTVDVEVAFFDWIRFRNNEEHPIAGHAAFKSKMPGDADYQAWKANADNIENGGQSVPRPVRVYNEDGALIALPAGTTLGKYAALVYGDKMPGRIQAIIDNDDPTLKRGATRNASPSMNTVLHNADRIILMAAPS